MIRTHPEAGLPELESGLCCRCAEVGDLADSLAKRRAKPRRRDQKKADREERHEDRPEETGRGRPAPPGRGGACCPRTARGEQRVCGARHREADPGAA